MARLLLTFKKEFVRNHLIVPGAIVTVGRDQNNDIVIDHPSVSKLHAKIRQDEQGLYLSDLGSTNGTFVNDDKVMECQLAHQDWISIGKHVLIVDLYETLSLEATVQMLKAGSSGTADAEGTMMLDMNQSTSHWQPLDYLNFLSGEQKDLELANEPVTIGKNSEADVVIGGLWSLLAGQPTATINKQGNDYFLDYVSGLLRPKVNGTPVKKPIKLRHQDIIQVGPVKIQLNCTQ